MTITSLMSHLLWSWVTCGWGHLHPDHVFSPQWELSTLRGSAKV